MPIDTSMYAPQPQPRINTPFETLAGLGALQEQRQRLLTQQQELQASRSLDQERQQKLADAERQRQATQALSQLWQQHTTQDPETGQNKTDHQAVFNGLMTIDPKTAETYLTVAKDAEASFTTMRDHQLAHAKGILDAGNGMVDHIFSLPSDQRPAAYGIYRQGLALLTPEALKQFPEDYPGDNALALMKDRGVTQSEAIANEFKRSETAKNLAAAEKDKQPPKRTEAEQDLDAFAKTVGKQTAEQLTDPERQLYATRKAKQASDIAVGQHARERQYDIANPTPPPPVDQQKLEKQYIATITGPVKSSRSPVGAEELKVQTANHLLSQFESAYNAKTDSYDLNSSQLAEMALGVARLTAGNTPVGEGMMHEFQQRTMKGQLASAVSYVTGESVPANTKGITEALKKQIERQGLTAVQNRDGALDTFRAMAPMDLDPERRQRIEKVAMTPLRQSRVIQNPATGQRRLQVSLDGGESWK